MTLEDHLSGFLQKQQQQQQQQQKPLCFVINVLNNKTIILLNLAVSRDFSQLGLRLCIRRYSVRFRRIIVK